jgi:hypothetical protein
VRNKRHSEEVLTSPIRTGAVSPIPKFYKLAPVLLRSYQKHLIRDFTASKTSARFRELWIDRR